MKRKLTDEDKMFIVENIDKGLSVLARHFNVHHTTILYYKRKHGLKTKRRKKITEFDLTKKRVVDYFEEEKINQGKTYKEYLEEEKQKNEKNNNTR